MGKLVMKSVGIIKALVGETYILIPLTYLTKKGERKKAMSYNRLNIAAMTGHAKVVFSNGEH